MSDGSDERFMIQSTGLSRRSSIFLMEQVSSGSAVDLQDLGNWLWRASFDVDLRRLSARRPEEDDYDGNLPPSGHIHSLER